MSKFAHLSLQQAVYDLLTGDNELMLQVTGIYENPAPNVAYPYLAFGNLSAADWSTKTTRGLQTVIPLHAYSRVGKKEVVNILDRVFELLQSGGMMLEGHELIAMRFEYNEILREADGVTYHGMIRFRAFTEEVVV